MKSVTIDQKSIEAVSSAQLGLEAIVEELKLPETNRAAKCVLHNEHGYILSRSFQPGDGLLIISLEANGPLTSLTSDVRQTTLGRLLRCASVIFSGRSKSVPISWRPFHYKNRVTFQADRRVRETRGKCSSSGRVVLDVSKNFGVCVYAFLLDQSGSQDIGAFVPNAELLNESIQGVRMALQVHEALSQPEQIGALVTLGPGSTEHKTDAGSLDEWYDNKLTSDQRKFVDYPFNASIKVVGPAGSGKTLTLVVKCLMELRKSFSAKTTPKCFLFLTHAASTVQAVEEMVLKIDPENGLRYLTSERPILKIATLYGLANEHMRYELDKLTPVSLDGHEGRKFQAEVLNVVLEDFRKGDWITYRFRCTNPFVKYIESEITSPERGFFLWELLNEFSCVLDAEGIRSGQEKQDKYLKETRRAWMMRLDSKEEREVVLKLYDKFREFLRGLKAIGSDQMVTDFLGHLDSFRWEVSRSEEGFDAIFVDELHLFNRQERMTFRHLLRNPKQSPVVLMAYDAKQSPRDTFLGLPSAESQRYNLWTDAKLGNVEKIELLDVFRYSPEIASALQMIDQSFPGQDLDSDWPPYKGITKTENGPIPSVCELPSIIETYAFVFNRAREIQGKVGRSNRVAVLCASHCLFSRYLEYTELKHFYFPITSRDEALGISHSSKKFVFSMPEYVAGLQYHSVLLIDVNRNEVPDDPFSASAQRKFVSQVYLGASRAEQRLEIYASKESGGISSLLTQAVLGGVIKKVEVSDLYKV